MKFFGRKFSVLEKIILLLMILVLLALFYYYFVDKPVKTGIKDAENRISDCEMVNPILAAQLDNLIYMQEYVEDMKKNSDSLSYMASYNNGEAEMSFLYEILSKANNYSINFSNVTKDGDLIRRAISLSFNAPDYETARRVIEDLSKSKFRCIVSNISISGLTDNSEKNSGVSVSCVATFYETIVGGEYDDGLPSEGEEY